MKAKIVITGDIPETPIIIEGFPRGTFIGPLAASYMIDMMKLKQIGYIALDMLNIAIIHKSHILQPIRIYAKKNHGTNIVVIISEVYLPFDAIVSVSHELIEWFDNIHPKAIISIVGYEILSGDNSNMKTEYVSGIGSTQAVNNKLKDAGVSILTEGTLGGISSDILFYCIDRSIEGMVLVSGSQIIPTPVSAANILNILNKTFHLNIPTEELIKKGEIIEQKIKELAKQIEEHRKKQKEGGDDRLPQMYT